MPNRRVSHGGVRALCECRHHARFPLSLVWLSQQDSPGIPATQPDDCCCAVRTAGSRRSSGRCSRRRSRPALVDRIARGSRGGTTEPAPRLSLHRGQQRREGCDDAAPALGRERLGSGATWQTPAPAGAGRTPRPRPAAPPAGQRSPPTLRGPRRGRRRARRRRRRSGTGCTAGSRRRRATVVVLLPGGVSIAGKWDAAVRFDQGHPRVTDRQLRLDCRSRQRGRSQPTPGRLREQRGRPGIRVPSYSAPVTTIMAFFIFSYVRFDRAVGILSGGGAVAVRPGVSELITDAVPQGAGCQGSSTCSSTRRSRARTPCRERWERGWHQSR